MKKREYEFTHKGHEYFVDGVEVDVQVAGYGDDVDIESIEVTEASRYQQAHPSGDVVEVTDKALIKELDAVLQELVEAEVEKNLADYLPDGSDRADYDYENYKENR